MSRKRILEKGNVDGIPTLSLIVLKSCPYSVEDRPAVCVKRFLSETSSIGDAEKWSSFKKMRLLKRTYSTWYGTPTLIGRIVKNKALHSKKFQMTLALWRTCYIFTAETEPGLTLLQSELPKNVLGVVWCQMNKLSVWYTNTLCFYKIRKCTGPVFRLEILES